MRATTRILLRATCGALLTCAVGCGGEPRKPIDMMPIVHAPEDAGRDAGPPSDDDVDGGTSGGGGQGASATDPPPETVLHSVGSFRLGADLSSAPTAVRKAAEKSHRVKNVPARDTSVAGQSVKSLDLKYDDKDQLASITVHFDRKGACAAVLASLTKNFGEATTKEKARSIWKGAGGEMSLATTPCALRLGATP